MLLKHREEGLLSQEDTISEALLFILAGHETTSRTMSAFIFRTHQNPEFASKIRSEIKSVIFENNTDVQNIDKYVTYDKLQELEYTTMCIKEALRIDPPAFIIHYDVKKSFTLNGIKIFKGMRCTPDITLIHNNPLIWHSPRESSSLRDLILRPNTTKHLQETKDIRLPLSHSLQVLETVSARTMPCLK